MSEHRVIGQRLPRPDAIPRVTGEAVYTDDITFPGMLHGAVARSPHARARILQIDTSQAEALPGVRAVLTPDNCDLFSTEIFYPGQKIAAVAAVDRHTAREAVALIEAEYETLPSICDPLLAMEPDAPEVHPSKHPDHNNVSPSSARSAATSKPVSPALRSSSNRPTRSAPPTRPTWSHTPASPVSTTPAI